MKIMQIYERDIKRKEFYFDLEQIWDLLEQLAILEACGAHFPLIDCEATCGHFHWRTCGEVLFDVLFQFSGFCYHFI